MAAPFYPPAGLPPGESNVGWNPAPAAFPEGSGYSVPARPQNGQRPQNGSMPFFDDINQVQNQGKEIFATVSASPITQLGLNYGKNMWEKSKVSGWFSLEPLKYYFNVNNSYVLNKLKILLCPFLHRNWKRQVLRRDDMEFYCPPRDDVNAPDLYVPLMAFVTYIIICGFVFGANMRFHPEVLGAFASKGFVLLFFEVLYIRTGFYFFDNVAEVNLLDIIAYSTYLFVLLSLNILIGFFFGSLPYYVAWAITSIFMATFMVRTLRLLIVADQSVKTRDFRNGFLMSIALLQFVMSYFLGVLPLTPIIIWGAKSILTTLFQEFRRRFLGPPRVFLDDIPEELLFHILSYLPVESIHVLASVSPKWRDAVFSDHFYELMYWKRYPSDNSHQDRSVCWREQFKRKRTVERYWNDAEYVMTRIDAHDAGVYCLRLHSPSLLISGCADSSIKLWDLHALVPREVGHLAGHTGAVRAVKTISSLPYLCSGGSDKQICIFDLNTKKLLRQLSGHHEEVWTLQFNEQVLISGSHDHTVRMWDFRSNAVIDSLEADNEVNCLQFDDTRLIVGTSSGTLQCWDLRTRRLYQELSAHTSWMQSLQIRGNRAITGSFDGAILWWDLMRGTVERRVDTVTNYAIRGLHFDPTKLVTVIWDGSILLWNPESDSPPRHQLKYNNILHCGECNDELLTTGSYDGTIQLWDFSRGLYIPQLDLD